MKFTNAAKRIGKYIEFYPNNFTVEQTIFPMNNWKLKDNWCMVDLQFLTMETATENNLTNPFLLNLMIRLLDIKNTPYTLLTKWIQKQILNNKNGI